MRGFFTYAAKAYNSLHHSINNIPWDHLSPFNPDSTYHVLRRSVGNSVNGACSLFYHHASFFNPKSTVRLAVGTPASRLFFLGAASLMINTVMANEVASAFAEAKATEDFGKEVVSVNTTAVVGCFKGNLDGVFVVLYRLLGSSLGPNIPGFLAFFSACQLQEIGLGYCNKIPVEQALTAFCHVGECIKGHYDNGVSMIADFFEDATTTVQLVTSLPGETERCLYRSLQRSGVPYSPEEIDRALCVIPECWFLPGYWVAVIVLAPIAAAVGIFLLQRSCCERRSFEDPNEQAENVAQEDNYAAEDAGNDDGNYQANYQAPLIAQLPLDPDVQDFVPPGEQSVLLVNEVEIWLSDSSDDENPEGEEGVVAAQAFSVNNTP